MENNCAEIRFPFFEYVSIGAISRVKIFEFSVYKRVGDIRWALGVTFRFRGLALLARKYTQCLFGTHWRMIYDSGVRNDICSAGTCQDCGHRWEGIKTPPMPKVKPSKEEQ